MLVVKKREFNAMVKALKGASHFAYDLETTGLQWWADSRILGMAFYLPDKDLSYYVPFRHTSKPNAKLSWMALLRPIFKDSSKLMATWNGKFDVHFTEAEQALGGVTVANTLVDGMLAAHLVNENESSFALKTLGRKYLGESAGAEEDALLQELKRQKLGKGGMACLDAVLVGAYAEQDVRLTWRMCDMYAPFLRSKGLYGLWYELGRYSIVVQKMEKAGILIDRDRCRVAVANAEERCTELMEEMVSMVGHAFNPQSAPQIQRILKVKSSRREVLETLATPFATKLLEYRMWRKAIGSYFAVFLEQADARGRLHCSFWIHGTVTGRLSCHAPNLQALPRQRDIYQVRPVFVAGEGKVLLSADLSQVELRILAHYTQDPFLMDAYNIEGRDIHQMVADAVGIERVNAKPLNFSMVYGAGEDEISRALHCAKQAARQILSRYHQRIPGIKRLYHHMEGMAKRQRYITMWTGRLRRYSEHDAHYKAMSNLIQGAVGELIRVAMLRMPSALAGTSAEMLLQVHDELVFELLPKDLPAVSESIRKAMEDFAFSVPIVVEQKVGVNYGEMSSYVPGEPYEAITSGV